MRFSIQRLAHLLLPPIIFNITRRMRKPEWEYVGDRWPASDARAAGWDDPSVANIMRSNWESYVRQARGREPLAFSPWDAEARDVNTHNVLMTYGYVLGRVGRGMKQLSVLDWGGALGNYRVLADALLPGVEYRFTVKEREALCAIGRMLLPDVSFTSSDDSCFSQCYDFVMASTSLQYAADWRATTRRLAASTKGWLFVTGLPVVQRTASFVAVQRPQRYGLRADYISWVLNREEFLATATSFGFTLEREFLSWGRIEYRNAPENPEGMGFLFRRV